MSKDSFVLYCDQYESIKNLLAEQKAELLDAIYLFQLGENLPKFDPVVEMAFSFIRRTFERDKAKYLKKCEKAQKSARMRWDANACERKKRNANDADTVPVPVPVPASDVKEEEKNICVFDSGISGPCPKKDYHPDFEKFWAAFPARHGKKNGKRKAFEKWWVAVRDNVCDKDHMLERITVLAPTYGEYPKDASTWINQRGWEDEFCDGLPVKQVQPRATTVYQKQQQSYTNQANALLALRRSNGQDENSRDTQGSDGIKHSVEGGLR